MKLIASDFDGTITRNGRVWEDDIIAIERWRKAGNLFGVISGRVLFGIEYEVKRHNIGYDYLVGASGGQAEDAQKKELFAYKCDKEHIIEMARFILENGGLSCGVGYERTHVNLFDIPRNNNRIDEKLLSQIPYTNQMNTYFHTDEEAKEFTLKVNTVFHGIFTAHQNGGCVDIPPFGVTKATGIAKVAKIYGVDEKDIITVGDNYNDITMLEAFNGVAVSTAKKEVKEIAKFTAENFTEIVDKYLN
jgi:Cof subfamily protein (haloacid dehalogenase superfamily)